MSFRIDKYRNVYTKYQKFPYQKLTGRNTMLYTGKIITGIDAIKQWIYIALNITRYSYEQYS